MQLQSMKFMLFAVEMDRAVAFWTEVFGLEPHLLTPHWSELGFGDAVLALHAGGTGEFHPTGLSLTVDDLDAAVNAVTIAGGELRAGPVRREEEPIRIADFTDPEGNGFSVVQNVD